MWLEFKTQTSCPAIRTSTAEHPSELQHLLSWYISPYLLGQQRRAWFDSIWAVNFFALGVIFSFFIPHQALNSGAMVTEPLWMTPLCVFSEEFEKQMTIRMKCRCCSLTTSLCVGFLTWPFAASGGRELCNEWPNQLGTRQEGSDWMLWNISVAGAKKTVIQSLNEETLNFSWVFAP